MSDLHQHVCSEYFEAIKRGEKTEIVMTANFREWRHFIRLRTSSAAHPQIRVIAGLILNWFQNNYPVIVEDLVVKHD